MDRPTHTTPGGRGGGILPRNLEGMRRYLQHNEGARWIGLATFIGLLVISTMLFYEDYTTTLYGYKMLPTLKVNDWVIPWVALIPQLTQVGMGYLYAKDPRQTWALKLAIFAAVVDISTDVYYKASGAGWSAGVLSLAILESVFLFTLASEWLLTVSLNTLIMMSREFFD